MSTRKIIAHLYTKKENYMEVYLNDRDTAEVNEGEQGNNGARKKSLCCWGIVVVIVSEVEVALTVPSRHGRVHAG